MTMQYVWLQKTTLSETYRIKLGPWSGIKHANQHQSRITSGWWKCRSNSWPNPCNRTHQTTGSNQGDSSGAWDEQRGQPCHFKVTTIENEAEGIQSCNMQVQFYSWGQGLPKTMCPNHAIQHVQLQRTQPLVMLCASHINPPIIKVSLNIHRQMHSVHPLWQSHNLIGRQTTSNN